jgi:hypothetical protein
VQKDLGHPLRPWLAPVVLACVALVVYSANRRSIGAVDTLSTELVPIAVLSQGSLDLTELERALGPPGTTGISVASRGGHFPAYPVTTGLVLTPFYALPVAFNERSQPTPEQWLELARKWGKWMAAAITAASVAVFVHLARRLGASSGVALGLGIAYAFGSSAWSVSSQALWQHGPSSLLLLLTGLLAVRHAERPTASRALAFGVAAGLAVAVRLTNGLFVGPFAAWVLLRQRRQAVALIVPIVLLTLAAMGANFLLYGHALGLYGQTPFDTPLGPGLAGILLSPGRGLLIYFPLALLAVAGLATLRRRQALALPWLPLAIFAVLQLLTVARFREWWGGACYGPRLLTEVQPALLLLAVPAFAVPSRWRAARVALAGALFAWAAFTQAVGALLYSGSWDAAPVFVDQAPQRLWDWRDNPIARDVTLDRIRWVAFRPHRLVDFRAEIAAPVWATSAAEATVDIPVRVRNTGSERWLPYGERLGGLAVNLCYHLAPLAAPAERREGARTRLPQIVSPGEEVTVPLRVTAPAQPGEYLVEVSLVQEWVDWFDSRGTPPARLHLSVRPRFL